MEGRKNAHLLGLLGKQLVAAQQLEHGTDVLCVLFFVLGVDQYIIEIC